MLMNRWVWLVLAAVILAAIGLFVWPTAYRTTEAPPAAQAPAAAPPVQPAKEAAGGGASEQKSAPGPAPAAAVQTAQKEPAPAQQPAAAPAAQMAEKETAPAPAQQPSAAPAARMAEKERIPAPASSPAAPAALAGEKASAATDKDADPHANDKAGGELAALHGFVPKDLVAALNDSVINFPSDSAEVPASVTDLLQKGAEDLKQLPKGHEVEIAGYTDNTGDQARNVALSLKRAEAVRQMLIKFGADPNKLIAKGYGSADPVASNDTPEGRQRNRRIEYRIVKTP